MDSPGATDIGLEGMGNRLVMFLFVHLADEPNTTCNETLKAQALGLFTWAWSLSADEAFTVLQSNGQIKVPRDASIDAVLERAQRCSFSSFATLW